MTFALLLVCSLTSAHGATQGQVDQVIDVAPVWSGHPVNFALLTHGKQQFVAFYDAERRMTVGSRTLDSSKWQFVRLPTSVAWDSHNYIVMTIDDEGLMHLSGNMHCVPMIYFRTKRPGDITTLERCPMVGERENSCTYPHFVRGPKGELIFTYRDGRSGRGDTIWNVYDGKTRTWRRLLDEPLFSGEGKRNAYFRGPVRDEQGIFHVCWVWRNAPDCATNNNLSYARSKDLVHWETSGGRPLSLPITIATAEVVDPVPPGGGIINGNTKLGFDGQGRPVITYHKFDAAGNTQLYNARREAAGWKIYQTSDWDYRWEFSGGGSIGFGIYVEPIEVGPSKVLTQSFHHIKYGSGTWRLDEATFKPLGPPTISEPLYKPFQAAADQPEMARRFAQDTGESDEPGVRYMLRWETRPPHRDRPYDGDPPPPSMLRLCKLKSQ